MMWIHGGGNQGGSALGLGGIEPSFDGEAISKRGIVYGFENFEDSSFPGYGVKPVMMFCGNDPTAKAAVAELLKQLGWEPLDVGGAEQALHLEHMTLLWVRMVRAGGLSPNLVWAALRR